MKIITDETQETLMHDMADYVGWVLVRDDLLNHIHVVPTADLHEHEFDNCKCNPESSIESTLTIVTHNSFDGREDYETNVREKN